MLDVLHELRIRYILVEGVATEDVQQVLVEKAQSSEGRGLIVKWSPQFAILAHPVRFPCATHVSRL
jgi:hypothetical protein